MNRVHSGLTPSIPTCDGEWTEGQFEALMTLHMLKPGHVLTEDDCWAVEYIRLQADEVENNAVDAFDNGRKFGMVSVAGKSDAAMFDELEMLRTKLAVQTALANHYARLFTDATTASSVGTERSEVTPNPSQPHTTGGGEAGRDPVGFFQWNDGWKVWEQVTDLSAGQQGVVAFYDRPTPTPEGQTEGAVEEIVRGEIKRWTDTRFPKGGRVGSGSWVNGLTRRILAALSTSKGEG